MRPLTLRTCFLFFCLSLAARALAWNAEGHLISAQIAYNHLLPSVKTQCDALIALPAPFSAAENDTFVTAACWADDEKTKLGTGAWHFIDLPLSLDGTSTATAEADLLATPVTVVDAIREAEFMLQSTTATLTDKAPWLRYLLHFVGDIHQPLHACTGVSKALPHGDAGGNDFDLKGTWSELHALWDAGGGFAASSLSRPLTVSGQATIDGIVATIEADYPYVSNAGTLPDPMIWAQEGLQYARTVTYVGITENSTPSTAYLNSAEATSELRLGQAGHRLADVLNTIFGPAPTPTPTPTPTPIPTDAVANYLLGFTTDSTHLDLNSDGKVDAGDLIFQTNHLPPGVPQLLSPADRATSESVTVTLQWLPAVRATSYDIWLWSALNAQPVAPTSSSLTVTHYKPSAALSAFTVYKWQLRAKSADGATSGPQWRFTPTH